MDFFDTHAHYYDSRFDADRAELLTSLPAEGIALALCPGCDVPSSRSCVALAEAYPHLYAAVGIHPEDCAGASEEDFAAIRALAAHPKVKAIGEVGLDYYWKENPPRDFQQAVFRRQLALAEELDLPVIVHDREAHGDCLNIVRDFPRVRGVFHCYSGSPEMARELVDMGWYLGFDGPITYKNARRAPEVIAAVPLERILIETDAPYMAPEPHRGRRNDSRYVRYMAQAVARYQNITVEEAAAATLENGRRLFRISDESKGKTT